MVKKTSVIKNSQRPDKSHMNEYVIQCYAFSDIVDSLLRAIVGILRIKPVRRYLRSSLATCARADNITHY